MLAESADNGLSISGRMPLTMMPAACDPLYIKPF